MPLLVAAGLEAAEADVRRLRDLGCEVLRCPGETPAARLDALVDQVNRRYGSNAVRYGSMGFDRKWRMRQERKSRAFTTRWEELLVAIG